MPPQKSWPRAISQFPPALQTLIGEPTENALHLVLETAGARSTWLALRYASTALERRSATVTLATWSYGAQFWKQELRKSANIDVDKQIEARKLVIIDANQPSIGSITTGRVSEPWHNQVVASLQAQASSQEHLLILDSPDWLLGIDAAPAPALLALITQLRTLAHSTVILTSSDIFTTPTESAAASPLQQQQQYFLASLLHQADYVLAARVLDTGQAVDVSGVLRITRAGHGPEEDDGQVVDKEFLYHVDASRAARVWQRGSGT